MFQETCMSPVTWKVSWRVFLLCGEGHGVGVRDAPRWHNCARAPANFRSGSRADAGCLLSSWYLEKSGGVLFPGSPLFLEKSAPVPMITFSLAETRKW
jgi:hypothetical protein